MRRLRWVSGLALLVISTACYHATIETGASPSGEVISKSFASGWILGLVPPSTVSTAAKCPAGPARIETQLSFVNQLVAWLTLYIYTPMEIKVTCAASSASAVAPPTAPPAVASPAPSDTVPPAPEPLRLPPGTQWIASIAQKLYYPANCEAARNLPESDRLYFASEPGPQSGFKRSIAC